MRNKLHQHKREVSRTWAPFASTSEIEHTKAFSAAQSSGKETEFTWGRMGTVGSQKVPNFVICTTCPCKAFVFLTCLDGFNDSRHGAITRF